MSLGIPIIGGIIELGKSWLDGRKRKTEAKLERDIKIIEREGEADTASASDMQTSWKDEYLAVVFTVPLLVVFYASVWGDPADIEKVKNAFAAMSELPEWYMWSIIGIVAGTFGLRALSKIGKE